MEWLESIMISKLQVSSVAKRSRHQRSDGDCGLRLGLTNRFGSTVQPYKSRGVVGQSPLPADPVYVDAHEPPPRTTDEQAAVTSLWRALAQRLPCPRTWPRRRPCGVGSSSPTGPPAPPQPVSHSETGFPLARQSQNADLASIASAEASSARIGNERFASEKIARRDRYPAGR
jgi:hypothetical protein